MSQEQQMRRVTVTVSEEQHAAWREAAFIRRATMSDWIRKTLDANATNTIEKEAASGRRG